ncbi:MAG: hypothetical protein ACLQMS_03375 [Desulfomonilaceae bacterium]
MPKSGADQGVKTATMSSRVSLATRDLFRSLTASNLEGFGITSVGVQDFEPLVRLQAHSIREVQVLFRYTLQPVANCNCVAVKRGGEQQEVNDQSVG